MKKLRVVENFKTVFNNTDVILYLTSGVDCDALTEKLIQDGVDILIPLIDDPNHRHIIIRDGRLLYVSDHGIPRFTRRGYSVLQLHHGVSNFYVMTHGI